MDRDVEISASGEARGRRVIAVIGVDRYRDWSHLHNAVNDAVGAEQLFTRLGFESIGPALLDEAATCEAMRRLITRDLGKLQPSDSLVVFFAGHGHTAVQSFEDRSEVKTGYILPVDAGPAGDSTATWLRLDSWLSDIARLPARHILVILDACHSGIALDALGHWRDGGPPRTASLEALNRRRSRRVITSALDDQRAMDNGPVPGHSLFTGCLIEALSGGLTSADRDVVTGSEIGVYVQRRVSEYPGSRQTPDFGTLELDDRGELLVPIGASLDPAAVAPGPAGRGRRRLPWAVAGALAAAGALALVLIAGRSAPTPAPARPANPFVPIGVLAAQQHQVSRGEYARYLASVPPEEQSAARPRVDWIDDRPDEPLAWTTLDQANRFCRAIGARLPSIEEWEALRRSRELDGTFLLEEWPFARDEVVRRSCGRPADSTCRVAIEMNLGDTVGREIGFRCVR